MSVATDESTNPKLGQGKIESREEEKRYLRRRFEISNFSQPGVRLCGQLMLMSLRM